MTIFCETFNDEISGKYFANISQFTGTSSTFYAHFFAEPYIRWGSGDNSEIIFLTFNEKVCLTVLQIRRGNR